MRGPGSLPPALVIVAPHFFAAAAPVAAAKCIVAHAVAVLDDRLLMEGRPATGGVHRLLRARLGSDRAARDAGGGPASARGADVGAAAAARFPKLAVLAAARATAVFYDFPTRVSIIVVGSRRPLLAGKRV